MKVLYVTASLGTGGRERQLYELLRGLAGRVDCRLLVLSETLAWDIAALGVKYTCLPKSKRMHPQTLLRIVKLIRDFKPDIVHYWDYPSKLPALLAKLTSRAKLLDGSIRFVGEAPASAFVKLLKKLSFSIADHVVANSKEGLRQKHLLGKGNASVIYNGMDNLRFKTGHVNDGNVPDVPTGKLNVVMVAGFQPAKDYLTLIQAAVILCPRHENLNFVLVGDGILRESCEAAVNPDIRERIRFLGNRGDVESILLLCDIGVLLSSDTEGLSNSIMEYMAAGLPVVATGKGGTPELVDDGESGFLIDNFQVGQLTERLERLILDPTLRKTMGERGAWIIQDKFSYAKMLDAYLSLYGQLSKRGLRKAE